MSRRKVSKEMKEALATMPAEAYPKIATAVQNAVVDIFGEQKMTGLHTVIGVDRDTLQIRWEKVDQKAA